MSTLNQQGLPLLITLVLLWWWRLPIGVWLRCRGRGCGCIVSGWGMRGKGLLGRRLRTGRSLVGRRLRGRRALVGRRSLVGRRL